MHTMKKQLILLAMTATLFASCGGQKTTQVETDDFNYTV